MITQKEKDDLVLLGHIKGCTLDGKSAHISGRLLNFPFIVTFDGKQQVEFSWEAVKLIMDNDGKFSS